MSDFLSELLSRVKSSELSIAEIADASGVPRGTLYKWTRNVDRTEAPRLHNVQKLAAFFGMGLAVNGKDTPSVTEINSPEDEAARSNGLGKEIKGA